MHEKRINEGIKRSTGKLIQIAYSGDIEEDRPPGASLFDRQKDTEKYYF